MVFQKFLLFFPYSKSEVLQSKESVVSKIHVIKILQRVAFLRTAEHSKFSHKLAWRLIYLTKVQLLLSSTKGKLDTVNKKIPNFLYRYRLGKKPLICEPFRWKWFWSHHGNSSFIIFSEIYFHSKFSEKYDKNAGECILGIYNGRNECFIMLAVKN